MTKNEASYLRPVLTVTLAASGTFTPSAYCTVVRITATTTTTCTFNQGGATGVQIIANMPEYFRIGAGQTITAAGAMQVVEMA